jgi:uncharacterized protein (TIGR00661 family)
MKILFGICSWGLGHATRDLPLIQRILKEGHNLTLVAKGRSLHLLKEEFGKNCSYLKIPDYSSPYSEKKFQVGKFVGYFPIYLEEIVQEHNRIKKLLKGKGYERIISDNRFGIYDKEVPSYFISHQLRFIAPSRVKLFERATEGFNYSWKRSFCKFLVPDYKENPLSGDLSHNLRFFKDSKVEYLGILSSLKKQDLEEDIDYFISLSGPEPQRTVLERKILSQVFSLKGKVFVALGKPEEHKEEIKGNVHILSFLPRERQEEIMNRAKLVITRPGYTTLMELAFLKKKALLIPTPGQTEQIYLASYHKDKGNFYSVSQDELNLIENVEEAKKYKGFHCRPREGNAVDKFMEIVFGK